MSDIKYAYVRPEWPWSFWFNIKPILSHINNKEPIVTIQPVTNGEKK